MCDLMDTDLSFLSATKHDAEFDRTSLSLPCALPLGGAELPDRRDRKELSSECDMPRCLYMLHTGSQVKR